MFKTKDIISKITIAIGFITIIYSVFIYSNNEKSYGNSSKVDGKLLKYKKNEKGLNLPVIYYIVDKDTFYFKSNNQIGTFPKENRVTIVYNVDNPSEAKIYESYKNLGIPISVATIGGMILLFGLIMHYFSWKKSIPYTEKA